LGHGIGLDVHELPRVSESSADFLLTGNVITLEPGIYIPEVGGVRIEDDFLVTDTGVENLTPISREAVCVA
jgi:Xaa-Pro aminopeptidase/Xaa-Pro dipeptidase